MTWVVSPWARSPMPSAPKKHRGLEIGIAQAVFGQALALGIDQLRFAKRQRHIQRMGAFCQAAGMFSSTK
ncbi:hypothetical protein HSBAA_09570 [Vreelandella sulfidaeris]|uniref:Uncharacterized protein n=1 Tax=Vreelandella sulfidaeris TaxID=115553 RepID=A0A455U583_9GAMM|nr:hypothetical protein HSBAA_09570 [Halomonas sulfidaeris]